MFDLGMPELIVILIIAVLVFGPGRLPEVGKSLGRAIRGFKQALSNVEPKELEGPKERESTKNNPSPNG